MPAVDQYEYMYFLGMDVPDGTTVVTGPSQSIFNTLADPDTSGETLVDDPITWSGSILPVKLYGFASNGDPVLQIVGGLTFYYLVSDLDSWEGQPLGFSRSGAYTYCFLPGSQIATPAGEVSVERLTIGDPVLTVDGRCVAVKWVGRQTVSTRFGPAERLMPVRFAAGALGQGLPHADLTVTADHGMLVEGVICHAGALVNGGTITRVPLAQMGKTYTVYHVETENHEIILANGAPAETFIDNAGRRAFDNYAEFEALYGEVPEMQELPYPRAMSARQVPDRIRATLARRGTRGECAA